MEDSSSSTNRSRAVKCRDPVATSTSYLHHRQFDPDSVNRYRDHLDLSRSGQEQ